MRSLFVMTSEDQSLEQAENFAGDELVVLVVVDKNTLATNFDSRLEEIERRAHSLQQELVAKCRKCRVVVEWGEKNEAIANALLREKAQLLNA